MSVESTGIPWRSHWTVGYQTRVGYRAWPLLIFMLCLLHRVSIPLSILDPPHRYRIHRRKSFDASDTLALPRVSRLPKDAKRQAYVGRILN